MNIHYQQTYSYVRIPAKFNPTLLSISIKTGG